MFVILDFENNHEGGQDTTVIGPFESENEAYDYGRDHDKVLHYWRVTSVTKP